MSSEWPADALAALIANRLGLGAQKRWLDDLDALIAKLGPLVGASDPAAIVAHLKHAPFEDPAWRKLLATVAIGETRFLRHRSWFSQIERTALAPLIQARRRHGPKQLHIWSAACSTGEETYTLAVLLRELLPDFEDWRLDILGTDIRADAIEAAERGVFDARQLREIEAWRIPQHFEPLTAKRFRVRPELRAKVRFRVANLFEQAKNNASFGRFDLILCRNVLIYMEPTAQRLIASHLVAALGEDGWLAVSPAEALADWFKPLAPVNTGEAILFTRRAQPQPAPRSEQPAALRQFQPIEHAERPRLAKPAVRPAHPSVPADPVARLRQARDLADQGRLEEARQCCELVLGTDRLNAEATLLLAEIYSDIGDDNAAHMAARTAVYVSPHAPQAYLLLAGALSRLGKTDSAAKAMATARSLATTAGADVEQSHSEGSRGGSS